LGRFRKDTVKPASDSIEPVPIAVDVAVPEQVEADVLAVAVADSGNGISGQPKRLDERLNGRLSRLADEGELDPELGHSLVLHLDGELNARRIAAAGVGPRDRVDADALRTAAAAVARSAHGTVAWILDDSLPVPLDEQARAVVEGTVLGAYDPGHWRSNRGDRREIERVVLCTDDAALAEVGARAARVAEWTNRARDLSNAPPNELTPQGLAARAAEFAAGVEHLTAEALGPDELEQLGMGSVLAVARGSGNPPQLIVLRYDPPNAARADVRLGLVGKAITFDSGGISLKPALKMYDMKGDMSGGGAVVAGLAAVADLGIPVRALAVVAACENLVGPNSYRPGDILRAANGKTIEITNTDAEGRLVLADALWYARREGATHVLDLATLTGAMETALGDLYAGLFANDDEWRDLILRAAERSGDHAWPFPLHPRYRRYVDSDFADLKNSSELRQAGAVLAAEFLREFSGEGPWGHLDIAGPAFLERSRGDYMTQRGGTGYGVRLIVELAQELAA
jgi:leucyl aminopeptidase